MATIRIKIDAAVWRKIVKAAAKQKISPEELAAFYLQLRVGSTQTIF